MKAAVRLFKKLHLRQLLLMLTAALFLFSDVALAATGLTYHGRITKPDGNALEGASVSFNIQVRSPNADNCLIYEENQVLDMTGTKGLFVLTIGEGTRVAPVVDGGYSLSRLFANRGTMTGLTCSFGNSYTPGVADGRRLQVVFDEGAGPQALPAQSINYVPLAIEAVQVAGYGRDQLLRVADGTVATEFSNTNWTDLWDLITGNSSFYMKNDGTGFAPTAAVDFGGQKIVDLADPTLVQDAATKGYVDGRLLGSAIAAPTAGQVGQSIRWNAGNTAWEYYTPSATDNTKVPLAGGTMTGLLLLSADPAAALGAASKQYVDAVSTAASGAYVRIDGTVGLSADWDLNAATAGGTRRLTGLNAPTVGDGAANKTYTDANILGLPLAAPAAGQVGQSIRWNAGNTAWEYYTPTTSITADSLNFTDFSDSLSLDASTSITAPSGQAYALSIVNEGTGNSLFVGDEAADASPFVIDATGKVGIGLASPVDKLDVMGNIAVNGFRVLYVPSSDNTNGDSIALGRGALIGADSLAPADYRNVAIGAYAMGDGGLTNPARNVAVGYEALRRISSGDGNTVMGNSAASFLSGNENVVVGDSAGIYIYDGSWNTALGTGAMYGNSNGGNYNIAVGKSAIRNGTVGGDYNVGIGSLTGDNLNGTVGGQASYNVLIGNQAGQFITTGSRNIIIGDYTAGTGVTTGSNNILMGQDVRPVSATASGQLNIGNLIYATGLSSGTTASTGNVGIGTTSPTATLELKAGTAAAGTAPLKLAAGVNLTAPEAGAIEFDGTNLYFTDSTAARRTIATAGGSAYGDGSTIRASAGTVAAPSLSFNGDANTGFYNSVADTISVAANGIKIFDMSVSGLVSPTTGGGSVSTAAGTEGAPTFSFAGDTDTGWFRPAADTLAASTAGSERIRIDSSGFVGIGTDSPTKILTVVGGDALINGVNAGRGAFNGGENVAFGGGAMASNVSGNLNTAIGENAAFFLTGSQNTAIGRNAMYSVGGGGGNTGVGYNAIQYNSGGGNTVVGAQALGGVPGSTGGGNSAFGSFTLFNLSTGQNNVAVGSQAGFDVTTGSNNVILGQYGTGTGITSGSNNILIGNDVRAPSNTASNQLNIGNLIYATGLSSAATASTGNVGIKTSSPGSGTALSVEGQIRSKSHSQGSGTVDWSNGNVIVTSFDCGTDLAFVNLRDGGSYTLIVTGIGTTQCNFGTATTGDDAATVNYRYNPPNMSRTANSHTIYSLVRAGNTVYVSWISSF